MFSDKKSGPKFLVVVSVPSVAQMEIQAQVQIVIKISFKHKHTWKVVEKELLLPAQLENK